MLVLSRKKAEAIQLGGEITIKVLEVRGGRVRLGIEAPQTVRIQRSEVVDAPATSQPGQPVPIPRTRPDTLALRSQSAAG